MSKFKELECGICMRCMCYDCGTGSKDCLCERIIDEVKWRKD